MAIYRPPKPRWRLAVVAGVAGLAVGLAVGAFALGRRAADPVDALMEVAASVRAAAATLEVVAVEYRESVSNGTVVKEVEYRGARDALARSRARFREARTALAIVAADAVHRVDEAYERLDGLITGRASVDEVASEATALAALLQTLTGTASS